jgi:DNA replication protein DnaC
MSTRQLETVGACASIVTSTSYETGTRNDHQGRFTEHLTVIDLIVLEELGYLPFPQAGRQLLFHLVSRLYECTSIITTNRGWPSVFGDAKISTRNRCSDHRDQFSIRLKLNDN